MSSALKVYEADTMDAALLKDFASRPRVDFQSILDRVCIRMYLQTRITHVRSIRWDQSWRMCALVVTMQ